MADRYDERAAYRPGSHDRPGEHERRWAPREAGEYGRERERDWRRGPEEWRPERRYSGDWDRQREREDRDTGEWAREKWHAAQDWMKNKWDEMRSDDRERGRDRGRWEDHPDRDPYEGRQPDWDRERGPQGRWGAYPGGSREADWRGERRSPRDPEAEQDRGRRAFGEQSPEWRRERWSAGHAGWINRGDWGGDVDEESRRSGEWERRSNYGREDFGGYGREGTRGYTGNSYGGESGYGGASSFGYGGGMTGSSAPQYGGATMGRFAGRGPKGYTRSDERILEDISQRLTDHPDVDASEIEVQVTAGEVTLSGTVDHRHAKRIAEDLAEEVRGVREVHNHLRVKQRDSANTGLG